MTSYMTIEMLLPQKRLVTIGLRAREVRRYHVYHVRGMSVICGMLCGISGGGVNGNGKPDSFIVGCSCQWYVMVALWNVFRPSGSESTEVSYFGRPLPAITNPQAHVSPAAVGWLLQQTNGVICLRLRQHHFWRFASVVYLPFCVPSSPNVRIVLWCDRSTVRRSINLSVSHIPLGTRPTPCRYCVP